MQKTHPVVSPVNGTNPYNEYVQEDSLFQSLCDNEPCQFIVTSGCRYKGNIAKHMPDGYGELTLSNGDCYKGNWENGKWHGRGEFISSEGHSYRGEWENGLMHGYGEISYANGGSYNGGWKHGNMYGKGHCTNYIIRPHWTRQRTVHLVEQFPKSRGPFIWTMGCVVW